MADFDIQIKGGTVVDGTRVPRYRADVWIRDGKVAQIGGRAPGFAKQVIDADGLIVAPGFVDLHTHYDAQIRWDPYCTISGWHGVTSLVLGNCGFGFAPCKPDFRDRSMLTMTRTEAIPYDAMKAGMKWDWETIPEYLDSLDRSPKGINCIQYMPTASLMTYVMGLEAAKTRPATEKERASAASPSRGLERIRFRRISTARRWLPIRCAMRTSSTSHAYCAGATKASWRSRRAPAMRVTT
jgi:N-acyl-D-aspartate/D-glutamate deacylase